MKYNTLLVVLDDRRIAAESLFAQMLLFFISVCWPSFFQAESCRAGLFLQVMCAAAGRHAPLCFAVKVLACVQASFLLFRIHICCSRSSCYTLFCCGSSDLCSGIFPSVQESVV